MSYTLTAGAHTDVGMKRDHNEDYYYRSDLDKAVEKSDGYLFIAADGVGGNRGGGDASRVACEQLPKHFFDPERKDAPLIQRLTDAINLTHHDIRAVAAANPIISEMSCTIVILAAVGGEAVTAHLGDARIYQYNKGELTQITKDHSWVQEQVDAGLLTPEQAAVHRNRNVVTRTLGGSHMHQPEIVPTELKSGNRYLLCSDGLHGPVPHEALTTWIQQDSDLDTISKNMVDHANKNGGPDNIVAIIVQVGDWVPSSDGITRPGNTLILPTTPTQPIIAVTPPEQPESPEKDIAPETAESDTPPIPSEPPSQPPEVEQSGPEQTAPIVTMARSRFGGALYGVITVLVLAVGGLLVWLMLSGNRLTDDEPAVGTPTEIAVVVTIPTAASNSGGPVVAATSTRAPEPTLTATLLPTNTPISTPTENATAQAMSLVLTEVVNITATQSVEGTSTPTQVLPTATPLPPKLELLDIRCDGKHVFEPNALINFKWYGKESSTLVEGEWMQIAIQSATKPEGIARQITDRGANILPEPSNGEWLVPRKLSSFGIVGEGDLNWWVEYVVNDTIVDSSDTGCFRIVPKSEQPPPPPTSEPVTETPEPDIKPNDGTDNEGSNRSDE